MIRRNPLRQSLFFHLIRSQHLIVFIVRERREHRVYDTLLKVVPNLEERLMNASEEEVGMIAELASINHPCHYVR